MSRTVQGDYVDEGITADSIALGRKFVRGSSECVSQVGALLAGESTHEYD